MPVSRGRTPKKGRDKRQRTEPNVHDDLLRMYGPLLNFGEPLDVEMFTSDVLGTWWREFPQGLDSERSLGIDSVKYALHKGTPAAMAFVCALAATATSPELRQAAAEGRTALAARGVAEPPWAAELGRVEVGECWRLADVYGDQATLTCEFAYGGQRHMLIAQLDHGDLVDSARGLWISDQPDAVLGDLRDTVTKDPLLALDRIEPAMARQLLEFGIGGSDDPSDPVLADDYAEHRAIALARCRAMPEPDAPPAPPEFSEADRRAIADEFFTSPEGRGLPPEAERLVRLVVDFGIEEDQGRPLRVSPGKTGALFDNWLATDDTLDERQRAALGPVYTAWNRWVAARAGLPDAAGEELAETVARCVERFEEDYERNVSDARAIATRYLSDSLELEPDDLAEVLMRRMFAVPMTLVLRDDTLDPADENDRRTLIERDHEGAVYGEGGPPMHFAIHEVLANQLWDNEPPEVWAAAQRLTAAGRERHEALHEVGAVMAEQMRLAVLGDKNANEAAYRAALDALASDAPT